MAAKVCLCHTLARQPEPGLGASWTRLVSLGLKAPSVTVPSVEHLLLMNAGPQVVST